MYHWFSDLGKLIHNAFKTCLGIANGWLGLFRVFQIVINLECEGEDDTTVVTWTIYNPAVVLSAVCCSGTASQLLLTLPSVPALPARLPFVRASQP